MIKKLIESKSHEENILNCLEEFSEIIQGVTKHERCRLSGNLSELPKLRANIIEEMADCMISIEILGTLFSCEPKELAKEIDRKMERNIERLEK